MTLPISARIASCHNSHPILRRANAVSLHAEMSGMPDSAELAADWRVLSALLRNCEIDLYRSDDPARGVAVGLLADDAWNRGVMMRVRVGRDVLRGKGRSAPAVIDAVCTEVVL